MSVSPLMLTGAGLVSAVAILGTVLFLAAAPAAPGSDFRPPCVEALGERLQAVDVHVIDHGPRDDLLVVGVDVSGSNAAATAAQLEAAARFANHAPHRDVALLSVSDRSGASSETDLFLSAIPRQSVVTDPLCHTPECRSSSLFEQTCRDSLKLALQERAATMEQEVARAQSEDRAARASGVRRWQDEVKARPAAQGTSVLGFWRKVADLARVKGGAGSTTVVLLSDLVETKRADIRHLRRARAGRCGDDLPDLSGVHAVLLQTIEDENPGRWAARWDDLLACAGARVTRHRWTPALSLTDYLQGLESPDQLRTQGRM